MRQSFDQSRKPRQQQSFYQRRKSTGEEVLDEGEALWKIMEQVFRSSQSVRPSKLDSPPVEAEDASNAKKADDGRLPRQSAASSNCGKAKAFDHLPLQTRHPFAVGVMVDEPESKIQQDNTVCSIPTWVIFHGFLLGK